MKLGGKINYRQSKADLQNHGEVVSKLLMNASKATANSRLVGARLGVPAPATKAASKGAVNLTCRTLRELIVL
jgi:hypothetical protein